ncbi:hypothetical protein ACU4GD_43325 [Cupriavidus basilensis]
MKPEIISGKNVYSTTLVGALYGAQLSAINEERYFTTKKRIVDAQNQTPFPPFGYVSDIEVMADIAADESPRGKLYKDFSTILPNLRLSPSQVGTGSIGRNFSLEAERSLAKRRGKFHLTVAPEDPLLQADLSAALSKKLPLAEFVDTPQGAIPVTVRKLRFEERIQAERTETVTIAQYNVSFLAAALLMPRNASYLYDKRTGGIAIEYAYELKVGPGKPDLLRDTINRTYSACSNSRIVNVFGGVSAADFVANDSMRADCSGSATDISQLRKEVEGLLVEALAKQPILIDKQ